MGIVPESEKDMRGVCIFAVLILVSRFLFFFFLLLRLPVVAPGQIDIGDPRLTSSHSYAPTTQHTHTRIANTLHVFDYLIFGIIIGQR